MSRSVNVKEITPELEAMARAILDAHSQWEIENNRDRGAENQFPWQAPHTILLARAALMAIREIDDGVDGKGPLASAIAVVEDYYDDKWSVTVASEAWEGVIDHILGKPIPAPSK